MVSNVSLTDKVPLFIKEGAAILVQDTKLVRQTKDLGNIFQVVGAFKLDQSKSTDQVKYYRASAYMLSIKDFNDDAKVSQCLSQGCLYSINMLLTVT